MVQWKIRDNFGTVDALKIRCIHFFDLVLCQSVLVQGDKKTKTECLSSS